MVKLNIHELEQIFSNIKKIEPYTSSYISEVVRYGIGNDYFCFCEFERQRDLHIFIDNFPLPKKQYSSSIPIKTIADLQYFLKCVGLELIKSNSHKEDLNKRIELMRQKYL